MFSKLFTSIQQEAKTMAKIERKELIETLASILTIHEAGALVAQINEKNIISKAKRFGFYPIEDFGSFERMLKMDASFWLADEIVFSESKTDFAELSKEEQNALLTIFAFFAVGDGTISSMLAYQLVLISKSFECQCFYIKQLHQETVHGHVYGNMIQTLVGDSEQRDRIYHAVENVPAIEAMNQYITDAFTYPDGERQLYISLALSEYVFFTPLFCIIFWFRAYRQGKIQKVLEANEQIAKDEASHCVHGCMKYLDLPVNERYSNEEIHKIVDDVVKLVSNLAHHMIYDQKIELEELTYDNLVQYIKFVADDLLERVQHKTLYNVTNPFVWMVYTQFERKANMYEGTTMEYKRFAVADKLKEAKELNDRFNKTETIANSTSSDTRLVSQKVIAKKVKF